MKSCPLELMSCGRGNHRGYTVLVTVGDDPRAMMLRRPQVVAAVVCPTQLLFEGEVPAT